LDEGALFPSLRGLHGEGFGESSFVGKPGGGLLTGDFESWAKGLCFPPLGDSMVRASGRAPLLGNLEDEVFEGYMKCPAVGSPTI